MRMTSGQHVYKNAGGDRGHVLSSPHWANSRRSSLRPWVVLLLWSCLAVSPLGATGLARPSGLDYRVAIMGISNNDLRRTLEEISDTIALRKERPPMTLSLLRRRAQRDLPAFLKALRAEGYYKAAVRADVDSEARPLQVTFHVDLGPAYVLKRLHIQTPREEVPGLHLPGPEELGLPLQEPARARAILDAQEELLRLVQSKGFPFAKIKDRRVIVDHAEQSVAVLFRLEPGPPARFGPTRMTGLKSVHESLVLGKIPWQKGDLYNADLLAKAHKRLTKTGLFAMVKITRDQILDEEDLLPITVGVTERKHRSVGAGISYKTDEGPGAKISWEHRNLFHQGERLSLTATASDFTLAAEGNFKKPGFWQPDQTLLLNLRAAEDRPDAYTSRNLRSSALIERDLDGGITVGGGLAFKTSKVTQQDEEESFSLLLLPLHFEWDNRDDPLEPKHGSHLATQLAPYYDVLEGEVAFVKGEASLSHCLEMRESPSLVVAARVAAGAMGGVSREAIPADERFYAGGGGSVRGYPFQSVGPVEAGEPLGGRSLFEVSTELRLKVTDRIGLVAFLDGGTVFETTSPDFSEDLLWGAGLGLRYFTPIGPFRLDVAVPLNRRPDIDDSFQVYVSLGEAF